MCSPKLGTLDSVVSEQSYSDFDVTRTERDPMFFLVAALLLLGVVLGSAAHLPLPVTLAVAAVIGVWLLVFTARERLSHRKG